MPIRKWIATFRPRWDRLLTGPWLWWLILWAAWAARLWQLDASSLTFDEAATFFVTDRPLSGILAYLRGATREHPPVYYLLLRLWTNLAGSSEYGLRFFSVMASLLGIALTARLARTLARRLNLTHAVGLAIYTLLPTLILALFPFEVYYAREARMYTLTIVWATLSSLLFLPLLFDREWLRPSAMAGLVFVNALALFTHYYLVLLIVTQFVSLLLLRRWRPLLAWGVAHGLVGLVGLVWLVRSSGLSASLTEAWGRFAPVWPTIGQLRRLLADLLFGPVTGVPWNLVYSWGLLVALGLLVVWLRPEPATSSVESAQPEGRRSRSIGAWLTITTLLPLALAFLLPELPLSRRLIFLLPFAALALGQLPSLVAERGPAKGKRFWKPAAMWLGLSALVISVLGVYGLPRTVTWIRSRYGHTIATIGAHVRPGDGILFYGPWQAQLYYYYKLEGFSTIPSLPPWAPPQLVPEEAEPVLQELMDSHQRLWVIPAAVDDVDPRHFVEGWLNTYAHPVWTTHDLSLYLPPLADDAPSVPLEFTFGDRLRLVRLASDGPSVPAGESLRLALTWAVSDALAGDVELKLELVDGGGRRWLEWVTVPGRWLNPPSAWKAGDLVTDRQGLIVPQGAPLGPFTLRLTVIDEASGAPLPAADAAGPRPQPGVDLFTFQVTEPVAPAVLVEVDDFAGPFTFEAPGHATEALTLVAYGLGGLRFQPGYPVPLRLHWLAPAESVQGLELRLQLWRRPRWAPFWGGEALVATESLPLIPGYPATDWPSGRLVSLPTALPIPADVTPGRADLTLTVLGPDGQPWTVGGGQRLTLGTLTVEERPMLKKLPAGLTAAQIDFGDQIGLRGYRIEGEARPGGRLDLSYAWYALRRPDRQYAVFNHLLTADGRKVAQVDGWPQDPKNGKDAVVVLTTQWRPGEYIPDGYTLEIPADAPPGPYLLAVGLYDAATVERLHAFYDGQPLPNDQWLVPVGGGQ